MKILSLKCTEESSSKKFPASINFIKLYMHSAYKNTYKIYIYIESHYRICQSHRFMCRVHMLPNYKNVTRWFVAFSNSALKTTVHNLKNPCFELESMFWTGFFLKGSFLIKLSVCLTYLWKILFSIAIENGYFFTNWEELFIWNTLI